MKIYKIRSDYDCLVKSKDSDIILDSNSQIVFDTPEQVLVYPLSLDALTFPFVIDLASEKKSPFFQRFNLKDCDLIYIFSRTYIKNEIIENLTLNQNECQVFVSQSSITFQTKKYRKTFCLSENFENYNIETKDDLVLLKLTGKAEYLWAFNADTGSLNYLQGEKIEKIDNNIFVTNSLNKISYHSIYQTYEISNNQILKKSENLKSNFEDSIIRNPNLIPFAFLEAVEIEDLNLARRYLCEKLAKEASNEHLQKFFGRFTKIMPLDDGKIGLVEKEKLKIITFTIKDNQIIDINLES